MGAAGLRLARGEESAYLGAMALPRPSSPRALWADLKGFAADRGKHQWIAAAIALAIPGILIGLFVLDSNSIKAEPQLIYVESWSADRTDAEIIADQKKRQAEKEALQQERQRQMKRLGERLEKIGI